MSESQEASERWMLERMKQTPAFTFSDLWSHFGASGAEYRQADKLIQRERRAGRIVQTEKRGVWKTTATPEPK